MLRNLEIDFCCNDGSPIVTFIVQRESREKGTYFDTFRILVPEKLVGADHLWTTSLGAVPQGRRGFRLVEQGRELWEELITKGGQVLTSPGPDV